MRSHLFRLLILSLLIFASFASAYGQSASERQQRIREEVEQGDVNGALRSLQEFRAADSTVFALNNYDYLLARLSERSGDAGAALANYQAVASKGSALAQYALWHLAQLARSTGNLVLERQYLNQLMMLVPASLLRNAAQARLAESFYESGDYTSAIAQIKNHTLPGGTVSARELSALIAQAYLRSGQKEAAREIFNSLLTKIEQSVRPDDFALAAARGLDTLDSGSEENAERQTPQLSDAEHMRRAYVYHFNRDFAGARRHYAALIEQYPQSASLPEALYQMGRSLFQEGRYEEAIPYFQRVSERFPQSNQARDALSSIASSYSRLKRTDEAIASLKRFIELYPNAPNPERSYLNIVDALRDAGRDAEALEWISQTRSKFRGQLGEALAIFSEARLHFSRNEWQAALANLEELRNARDLGGVRAPGGTNSAEVAFLRAFALEQLGRFEEAVNTYLSIPDGRNEYYGGRATERLLSLNSSERAQPILLARLENFRKEARDSLAANQAERARIAAQSGLRLTNEASMRSELMDVARKSYQAIPSYAKTPGGQLITVGRTHLITSGSINRNDLSHEELAGELLFLGLYDEGAPELAFAWRATGVNAQIASPSTSQTDADAANTNPAPSNRNSSPTLTPDQAYTLAVLYKRGDRAFEATAYAEPLWKRIPGDYLLELAPRESVEMLYPAPYRDALLTNAPARGVDARFILSIARQETRFRPDAKSAAAARGLLQFIPSTADEIARQLNFKNFSQDDLYDPRISILFGAQYMGNLFKMFPQMPQAVAASYNGGEDNVARWVARARSNDADRYVAEIGFTQSKDYVYRVLSNYRVYQSLYTEQLQRR